jgi:hypothetical protein
MRNYNNSHVYLSYKEEHRTRTRILLNTFFLIMDIKSGLYIQRCTQPKVTKGEKKQKREKSWSYNSTRTT